jgi:hypothetical protein
MQHEQRLLLLVSLRKYGIKVALITSTQLATSTADSNQLG